MGVSCGANLTVAVLTLFIVCFGNFQLSSADKDAPDLLIRNRRFDEEYEEDHPHNVTILEASYTFFYITWEEPSINASDVLNYEIKYHQYFLGKPYTNESAIHVSSDSTKAYIRGLKPGTKYSFYVVANLNGLLRHSSTVTWITEGFGPDNRCDCDIFGSASPVSCDSRTGQCKCENKYTTGLRCDRCVARYYLHEHHGCQPCRCPTKTSNGSCFINENGVVMCSCREGHSGIQCNLCDGQHYLVRSAGKCAPCKCNENGNTSADRMCDMYTGRCIACSYNTTGDHCEVCLPGYKGDALYRNCTAVNAVVVISHQAIVVITVCFTVILTSVMVLLVITLLRCRRNNKRPLGLWSVHLRDDRENVNFSAVRESQTIGAALLSHDEVEYAANGGKDTREMLKFGGTDKT